MAKRERLTSVQITIAELAVVGAIAPAEPSSLDGYLKFVGLRVRDGTSFLFDPLVLTLRCPTYPTPPRIVGSVGREEEGEAIRVASPLAHAGRMLQQTKACDSASLGLGRCLLMLRAPLRETVGGWDDSDNSAGREEGEITSWTPPHGSVEADIHVEKTPTINAGLAHAGLASCSCVGEIMASHEERFEASTSFARRINLARRAWIGMCDDSCSGWMASCRLFLLPLR
jgi:hypothetical protein